MVDHPSMRIVVLVYPPVAKPFGESLRKSWTPNQMPKAHGKTLAKRCKCAILVAQHVLTQKGSFFVFQSPCPILSAHPHRSWFILFYSDILMQETIFLVGCVCHLLRFPLDLVKKKHPALAQAEKLAPFPPVVMDPWPQICGSSFVPHGMDWLWTNNVYIIHLYLLVKIHRFHKWDDVIPQ